MSTSANDHINKPYIIGVSVITFILPLVSYSISQYCSVIHFSFLFQDLGKWFIFYAVGFRLILAGIRQIFKPAFTAKVIFQMENTDSYPVIRELGFANLCFGLIGLVSLFMPGWRMVSAFGSGLYYGLAALQHSLKKNAGINQKFALYTDVIISLILAGLFCLYC